MTSHKVIGGVAEKELCLLEDWHNSIYATPCWIPTSRNTNDLYYWKKVMSTTTDKSIIVIWPDAAPNAPTCPVDAFFVVQ